MGIAGYPVHDTFYTCDPPASAPPPALPETHRISLVPHLESHRSFNFDTSSHDLSHCFPTFHTGRFIDRSRLGITAVNAYVPPNSPSNLESFNRQMQRFGLERVESHGNCLPLGPAATEIRSSGGGMGIHRSMRSFI